MFLGFFVCIFGGLRFIMEIIINLFEMAVGNMGVNLGG